MNEEHHSLDALRIERTADGDDPPRRRWPPWAALAALVALAAATGLWWLDGRRDGDEGSAAAVPAGAAGEGTAAGHAGPARSAADPAAVLDASGYVTARRQATVSSKITGKIVEVLVEEGMAVEEGQVLARLDDSGVRAALALSEAELEAARRAVAENEVRLEKAHLDLSRARSLFGEQVTAEEELDTARAEVDALGARLALARGQVRVAERAVALQRVSLADTVIRAPFDGVAISKDAQPGEMISPVSAGGGFTRTGVCTVVDMESLEIEVDVGESYIQRVSPGQRVRATLDAYPEWQIPARVITIVPAADRDKATVRVRIGFDRLDPRILPDMGVRVAFLGDGDEAVDAGEGDR